MDSEVLVGAGSVADGAVVATISYIANRTRAQAESRKIDAETDKIRAETALLRAQDSATTGWTRVPSSVLPTGWHEYGEGTGPFELRVGSAISINGHRSATIRSASHDVRGFPTMMQTFRASRYHDSRVRLSAFLRTRDVEEGAWLWMRVDGPGQEILGFDNMANRLITDTTERQRHDVVLDVPAAARAIAIGFALSGRGQLWADSLAFEAVGPEVPTTNRWENMNDEPTNLAFAHPPPHGPPHAIQVTFVMVVRVDPARVMILHTGVGLLSTPDSAAGQPRIERECSGRLLEEGVDGVEVALGFFEVGHVGAVVEEVPLCGR